MKRLVIVLILIAETLLVACKKEREIISAAENQRCLLKEARFVGNTFLIIEYDQSRRISHINLSQIFYTVTYRPDGKVDKLIDDSSRFHPFIQYLYPNPRQIIKEIGSQGTVLGRTIYTLTSGFVTKEEYYTNRSGGIPGDFILHQVIEIKRDGIGNRLFDKTFIDGKLTGTLRYENYDGKKNPLCVLPYGLMQGFDSPQNFSKSTFASMSGEPLTENIIFYTYNEHNYATERTEGGQSMDFIFDCFK